MRNKPKFLFVLSSHWKHHYEIPASIPIIKSILKRNGVRGEEILDNCSLDRIPLNKNILRFQKDNPSGKIVFFISLFYRTKKNTDLLISELRLLRKKFKNSLIAIGGSAVTVAPEIFMEEKTVDIVTVGEGEISLPYILKYLLKKSSFIPNSYILKNRKYCFNKAKGSANIKELYRSQTDIIKNFNKKLSPEKNGFLRLEFSRGCYFNCSFCYEQMIRKRLNLDPEKRVRMISPEKAVLLLRAAEKKKVKKFFICSNSLTFLPKKWLDKFSALLSVSFAKNIGSRDKPILRFDSCPIDFQRKEVKNFIKKLRKFFYLFMNIGFEALDKETLYNFNKPHQYAPKRIINDLLFFLQPYIEKKEIGIFPNFICLHPWTNFKKIKGITEFWFKWGLEAAEMDAFIIYFIPQSRLDLPTENLPIVDILKKNGLFLRKNNENSFKFLYEKKVLFPKNKDDTDLKRLVFFHERLKNLFAKKFGFSHDSPTEYKDFIKEKFKEKDGKRKENNEKFYKFYLRILNDAEYKWPRMSYQKYEKESDKKIMEILEMVKKCWLLKTKPD
ncbi:MAG: radical SAM protein [Candidatus Paceibacterota bacterium]|jgi:hypothetical protein